MTRLTTVEALESLPLYTAVQGESSVPILAHQSSNGMWWSTVRNPLLTEDLLELCPEGFVVLRSNNDWAQEDVDLEAALNSVEVLEFFARFGPVDFDDYADVRRAVEVLRSHLLRDVTLDLDQKG